MEKITIFRIAFAFVFNYGYFSQKKYYADKTGTMYSTRFHNNMYIQPISSLESGKILSRDVYNANGRKLFTTGHIITEKTLRILKIWGIRNVHLCEQPAEFTATKVDKINSVLPIENSTSATRSLFIWYDTEKFPISKILETCSKLSSNTQRTESYFFPYLLKSKCEGEIGCDDEKYVFYEKGFVINSLSDLFYELVKAQSNIYATSDVVVSIIEKDEILEKDVLAVCNCLIQHSHAELSSLYRVTAFLGNKTVLSVAILILVLRTIRSVAKEERFIHFGRSTITAAVAARYISSSTGVYGSECFFTSGALMDVGSLLFQLYFPVSYEKVRKVVLSGEEELCLAEERLIGMNHAESGKVLLKQLGYPVSAEKRIEEHHASLSRTTAKEQAVLQVAELLAKSITFNPAYDVPPVAVDERVWDLLMIKEEMLSGLLETIYRQSEKIIRVVYGE